MISERSISKFFMRFLKPAPYSPTIMSSVSFTSSKYISQNGIICWPRLPRPAVDTPGKSFGTSHMVISVLSCEGSSFLAITRQYGRASPAVTQVFWPLRIYVPSACFLVVAVIDILSEPAAGSEKPRLKIGWPDFMYSSMQKATCSSLPKSIMSHMASVLFKNGVMLPA